MVSRPSSDLNNRATLVQILSPAFCADSSNGRAQRLPFWVRSPASALVVEELGLQVRFLFRALRQVAQVRLKLEEHHIFNVEVGGSSPSLPIKGL